MTGYVLSPRAQLDLDDIWDYSLNRWGAARAERYVRDLVQALEMIAIDRQRGRLCDDIRAGYFKYAAVSHVIFYRIAGDQIDVVRILHGRMDFKQHL
jgi:toxin ParE1/3/4